MEPKKRIITESQAEHYKEMKKSYNSTKKSIQIPKELHLRLKEYCDKNNLDIKDFINQTLSDKLT